MSKKFYLCHIRKEKTQIYVSPSFDRLKLFMSLMKRKTYQILFAELEKLFAYKYCYVDVNPESLNSWFKNYKNINLKFEGVLDNGFLFSDLKKLKYYMKLHNIKLNSVGIFTIKTEILNICRVAQQLGLKSICINQGYYNLKLLSAMLSGEKIVYEDLLQFFNYNESFEFADITNV